MCSTKVLRKLTDSKNLGSSGLQLKNLVSIEFVLTLITSCDVTGKMARSRFMKNHIAFVCLVVSISCLLVLIVTVFRLPEPPLANSSLDFGIIRKVKEDERIGLFGEMMVGMLPDDLAFTMFIPSEKAFERDLRLRVSDSLGAERVNDTHAILSRVLGFSVVPRKILSVAVLYGKEMNYDSLSGLNLFISKDSDGLIVNRVRSKKLDIRKGEIVIHVMDGVIMDADFEQSIRPDDSEED